MKPSLAEIRPEPASPGLLFEETLLGQPPSRLALNGGVLINENVVDSPLAIPKVTAVDFRWKLCILPSLQMVLIIVVLWKREIGWTRSRCCCTRNSGGVIVFWEKNVAISSVSFNV